MEFRRKTRLVGKDGQSFLLRSPPEDRPYRYIQDLSNTLINSSWKFTLFSLGVVFVATWTTFAFFWNIVCLTNTPEGEGLPVKPNTTNVSSDSPCLEGINSFAGYFLFSIETQTTIGYGNRYINHHCPEAIFLICFQIVFGNCVCGYMICIVYLKMASLEKTHGLECFSNKATIYLKDGELCLEFRIKDTVNRRFEIVNKLSMFVVFGQIQLTLKSVPLEPVKMLIFPCEIVHRITQGSPFYNLSPNDLIFKRFELIVTLEGTCRKTSQLSSTTTSYLSHEILWGHQFRPCIAYSNRNQKYIIRTDLFNQTKEILTPLCSAKYLQQVHETLSEEQTLSHDTPPTTSNLLDSLQRFVLEDSRKHLQETAL